MLIEIKSDEQGFMGWTYAKVSAATKLRNRFYTLSTKNKYAVGDECNEIGPSREKQYPER